MHAPCLVVFDLDFTLWDCGGTWCDCTLPPYSPSSKGFVDSENRHITLYPDVMSVLHFIHNQGIMLAVASRTHEPVWARTLMALFQITPFFQYVEIFPGSKIPHFQNIRKKSGLPFCKMFFFDDEMRNIVEVEQLGVHCVYVEQGITLRLVTDNMKRCMQL